MAKYNFKQFLLILCFLLSTYAVSAPIFGVGFELSIICFALVMSFAIPLVARDKNAKKPNVVVVIAIIVLAFVAWYFLGERLRNSSVNIDNATIKQSEAKSNSSDTVINAAKSKQNASAMQTAETESSAATYSDVDAGTSEIKSEEVAVMKTAYKLSDDENEMMDQIYSVSRSGNWEKFLELFSVYDGIKPEMAKMFLLVAVDNKAPSDIITYLLNSGAEIDFQVPSKAVFSDNVKLLELLEEYGSDYELKDRHGGSIVNLTFMLPVSYDVFEHLVNKGAPIQSSKEIKDTLDFALEKSLSPSGILVNHLSVLLDREVEILPKHQEFVHSLKRSNPERYVELTEKFPQFLN